MSWRRMMAAILMLAALSGCRVWGLSPSLDIEGQRRSALAPVTARSVPLRFGEVTFLLRRGQEVGSYLFGMDCYAPWTTVAWTSGKRFKSEQNFADLFHDALTEAGFDVAGDPAHRFGRRTDVKRARYAVSANVIGLTLDLCRKKSLWTGSKLGEEGDSRLRVEWVVYDLAAQRIVTQVVTEGTGHLDNPMQDGDIALVELAFASAASALAHNDAFQAAVSSAEPPPPVSTPARPVSLLPGPTEPDTDPDDPAAVLDEEVDRATLPPPPEPAAAEWTELRVQPRPGGAAAVGPVGSGIGLYLGNSPEGGGLLLTQASALPVWGMTVERLDRNHGTALMRGAAPAPASAALRLDPPRVGEPVRVLGPAAGADGMVAAVRGPLILVDGVPPSPSALLLDESGRVLGLAAGGPATGQDAQGLARFLPVAEALRGLKVTVGG